MGDVCLWIRATLEILALWVENNRYCSQKCLSGACSAWKQNAQPWCAKHFVASLQGDGDNRVLGAEPICISFIMAKWLCKLAEDQSPWKKGHGRSLRPLATSSYARQPLLFGHPTWKYCLRTGKPSSSALIPMLKNKQTAAGQGEGEKEQQSKSQAGRG